jgi:hypothetical protein
MDDADWTRADAVHYCYFEVERLRQYLAASGLSTDSDARRNTLVRLAHCEALLADPARVDVGDAKVDLVRIFSEAAPAAE